MFRSIEITPGVSSVCSLPRLRGRAGVGADMPRVFVVPPTLTLQPKSDVSDFGQSISGRTQVNPSSAASGGGNAPSMRRRCASISPEHALVRSPHEPTGPREARPDDRLRDMRVVL